MSSIPLMKTKEFLPGLESQHEVGLSGVGVSVISCTLAVNTSRTAAQLIASPPNTGGDEANACGPVVHSLGTAPTATIPQLRDAALPTTGEASVRFIYCTADNSAVYLWAQSNTVDYSGSFPAEGLEVRIIALR